jgi:hypothetical protein
MDKIVTLRFDSARNALALRVTISLGIGMLLLAPSGCSKPVADTPAAVSAALTPPKVSPAGMEQYKEWRANQLAIQKSFFAHRPNSIPPP